MGKVIDFTDGQGDRAVLQQTESEGLLGGLLLADRPLSSYLVADEQPKYLLQNKKSGLAVVSDGGTETLEPGGDYQALALATDLRLLVVVGRSDGDLSRSLSLSEIVEADVDSGLRSSTLTIETLSGDRWEFTCKGDPAAAATYLEDAAQAWANAGRLLDDLEAAVDEATQQMSVAEYEEAAEAIAEADRTIRTAVTRAGEVGPAARAKVAERAAGIRERLRDIRREIHAQVAAQAHARAQQHWREDEYEDAASAYESAISSYESALDIDGSAPSDDQLRSRLRGATGERELLRVGPLVDAEASRRRAAAFTDSEAAAEQWEQALEGYRELLGLDWGGDQREFVVNRERIREQTVELSDDAIDDHLDAGVQWLEPGDELAVDGSDYEADELYKMARHQFEQAHQLATEVRPGRVDETEAAIEAVETRLDGERPREVVPSDPITTEFDQGVEETPDEAEKDIDWEESTVELSGEAEGDAVAQTDEAADGEFAGLSFPSAVEEDVQSDESSAPETSFGDEGTADETDHSDSEEASSVLDEIQSRKGGGRDEEQTPEEPRTDGAVPVGGEDRSGPSSPPAAERDAPASRGSVSVSPRELRTLTDEELTELVAAIWADSGWETQLFEDGADATYDVVATRGTGGGTERTLLWTIQRRDGGDVGEALLRRCATTLDNSPSADRGVVVTTGGVTRAAESLSVGFDVEVLDCPRLIRKTEAATLPPDVAALFGE